jgi:hypothetical protein
VHHLRRQFIRRARTVNPAGAWSADRRGRRPFAATLRRVGVGATAEGWAAGQARRPPSKVRPPLPEPLQGTHLPPGAAWPAPSPVAWHAAGAAWRSWPRARARARGHERPQWAAAGRGVCLSEGHTSPGLACGERCARRAGAEVNKQAPVWTPWLVLRCISSRTRYTREGGAPGEQGDGASPPPWSGALGLSVVRGSEDRNTSGQKRVTTEPAHKAQWPCDSS